MSSKQTKNNIHTNLTTLSPIEYRRDDPENRVANIRRILAKLPMPEQDEPEGQKQCRVFQQCPMLHMARLQIIDDVLPEMGARPGDSLKSKYLLFVADINGEIDDFLDALYNGPQSPFSWVAGEEDSKCHSEFVHEIWGRCIDYPKETGSVFFRRFMHRCRLKVALPYSANTHSVDDIFLAKHRQAEFTDFVIHTQGMSADALYSKWKDFRKLHAPGP